MAQHSYVVGFDAEIDGRDVYIEFTRTVKWGREYYGADADGNRGIWTTTVDEDEASEISLAYYDEDDGESEPTPFENLDPETRNAVSGAVTNYIETHEPEPPDEPEPDFDDMED